jgi:quinoprotein glucose dehydrogenase/quinate dehydrogenase (quinone)
MRKYIPAGWQLSWLSALGALAFALVAVPLVWGGVSLVRLGGSPYYVVTGLLLIVVAVLLTRGHRLALWLYAAIVAATIIWALGEVGLNGWALLPRIFGPALLGLWFAIPAVRRRLTSGPIWAGETVIMPLLFLLAISMIFGGLWHHRFQPAAGKEPVAAAAGDPTQWTAFGNDLSGDRFTPAALITPENAGSLAPAWTFQTGEVPSNSYVTGSMEFEAVPLKVGDNLYICTQNNTVIAIDGDSGQEIWRVKPPIDFSHARVRRCRGLAYHAATGEGICAQRLLLGTVDDQLMAFDARTGTACPDFGKNGAVDLRVGLGRNPPGFHFMSSPATIVGDVAVVGSFVFDNQSTDAVPGVIRAYDVTTGSLRWAWDVMHPDASPPLKEGEGYSRNGPNMWGVASADEALGLVFIPTGNPSPDYYGGMRTPEMERYGSSIIALDASTGNVRWSFQTTHHDVWDYDVASQPVLADVRTATGVVPAVLAPTKRGEIFVLDRATGKPLATVAERPVPQGPPPGDWLAPTQPFNESFPSFRPDVLQEASMWGVTPYDQLWCRITFRSLRYEGLFTPGSTKGAIHDPGANGVINWASLAVDSMRRIAIVNASWIPFVDTLIPRKVADAAGLTAYGDPSVKPSGPPVPAFNELSFPFPQVGTPYAVDTAPFLSPLGIPCQAPPWGAIAGIDLDTQKILWKRPFGTSRGKTPLGIELPIGVLSHGGAVTTAGGVTFIAAAIDGYLRAFETATGRILWQTPLPAGGQSSPISYVSRRTGRQYVVITAGGSTLLNTPKGDYLVAYALPKLGEQSK